MAEATSTQHAERCREVNAAAERERDAYFVRMRLLNIRSHHPADGYLPNHLFDSFPSLRIPSRPMVYVLSLVALKVADSRCPVILPRDPS